MNPNLYYLYFPTYAPPIGWPQPSFPVTSNPLNPCQITFNTQRSQTELKQNNIQIEPTVKIEEKEAEIKFIQPEKKAFKKKKDEEKDYKPYQRKQRRKPVTLKENRNVLPIKIRQMISFLVRQNKSREIVEKLFKKGGISELYSIKKFYAFIKQKKTRIENYVKEDGLNYIFEVNNSSLNLFPIEQQKTYISFIRVVMLYYLNHFSIFCILNSNRIQSCKKIEHLRAHRYLVTYLKTKAERKSN